MTESQTPTSGGAQSRDMIAEATRNWQRRGWHDAAPGMAAVTSLIRAGQLVQLQAEAVLEPFGITFNRYELLALLSFTQRGHLPMSKASEKLALPRASLTHTVTQMERQGLVERVANPQDGRGTLVRITDQGITLLELASQKLNAYFSSLGVPPSTLASTVEVCAQFRRAGGDTVENPTP